MRDDLWLAIVAALLGSVCFALSASCQHDAVAPSADDQSGFLPWRRLLAAMRRPRWLAGLGLSAAALALQFLALALAPVTVVQPLFLLALPWTVLLEHRARRRVPGRLLLAAVTLTVLATAGFSTVSALHVARPDQPAGSRLAWAVAVVYAVAAAFAGVGVRGPRGWRSLAWAGAGATLLGLEAVLAKALVGSFAVGPLPLLAALAAGVAVGSAGAGWAVQQSYATGPPDIAVGATTALAPIVGFALGVVVLGEGHAGGPALAAMAVLGALAVLGVVLVTVSRRREGGSGDGRGSLGRRQRFR